MRDPARIDRMLTKLRAAWLADPDSRLGQLIVNAVPLGFGDIFYVDDDRVEAGLDERCNRS